VLEHLPDDNVGIQEIHRVLKKGGIAIIFVPTFQSLWGITDEVSMHYRRYRLPGLKNKFIDRKFEIVRSSYFNTFLFLPIAVVRLAVRFFNIRITSEAETGNGIVNIILYNIFNTERRYLRSLDFPFGISGMIVAQKR
jgi:SAM-dependent methyltransferase